MTTFLTTLLAQQISVEILLSSIIQRLPHRSCSGSLNILSSNDQFYGQLDEVKDGSRGSNNHA